MNEKKERATEVRVAFDKPVVISSISPPGGLLTFTGPDGEVVVPSSIEVGLVHPRETKAPKVMTRAPVDPQAIQPDVNQVLAGFATVLVVDTNDRTIDGHRVCVAAPFSLTNIVVTPSGWSATAAPQAALEFWDPVEAQEHVGWAFVMMMIAASGSTRPIAVVVDSDLDALTAMNRRERPFFRDQFLPEGVTLVYASADRGPGELVGNKAIRECDKTSTRILQRIVAGEAGGLFQPVNVLGLSRTRLWLPPSPR